MEQMCEIGIGIVYPDRFAVVDLIVRGRQFEEAKDAVRRVNERIENDESFAELFDPEHGYVETLEREGIDSCVFAYITDATNESDESKNFAEFWINLDR